MLIDYKSNLCGLSIYQTNSSIKEHVKVGDEVLIKNPHLVYSQLDLKGRLYAY